MLRDETPTETTGCDGDPLTVEDSGGSLPLPQHLADLRRSGLTDETIRACGFYSSTDAGRVGQILHWKEDAADLGPCLVIPFTNHDGSPNEEYARVKPDNPLKDAKGKPRKYESPKGLPNRVFFPPGTHAILTDASQDLLVVEGEKKAAAATQFGFPCLGLVGVYGWQKRRSRNTKGHAAGKRELIPDLAAVAWKGRRVFVPFDSDAVTNPNVRKAERDLAQTLRAAGATPIIVRLPPGPEGAKQGLDDFLLAHGPDALRALLVEPAKSEEKDHGAALFRDEGELERLAALKLEDPALFEAEKAELRGRGVSVRSLEQALAPRVAGLRAELRAGADTRSDQCPYSVRGGATFRTVATKEGEVEVSLCNFAATITAVVARDDGAETTRLFTIAGRTAGGAILPPVDVPADQFSGMGWVTGAWGNRPVINAGQGTKDHLRAAIQILSGDVPERTVYAHLGWREVGGIWLYLHAGGALGPEGSDASVEVVTDGALAGFALPEPPTGSKLIASVRSGLRLLDRDRPLVPDRVLIPLLGATYRAVLGSSDFGIHLFGRTGVFKSELAALAQQHFGVGLDARNLPANWSSTANAIEATAFAAKDALLVVDDFNPTGAADPQKLHATADRVFRGLGNGAGRNRLSAELRLRPPRPPRALMLSTGEDVPRGHSLRARLPIVEVCPGDVDVRRLGECQRDAAEGVYTRAMAGFVHWLAPQYAEIRKRLAAERARARDSFAGDAPHARTPSAVGDLWLGWEYYLRFAVEIGAISPTDRDKVLGRVRAALGQLATAQVDHLRAADPVDQFLRLVPEVVVSGQAHISSLSGGPPDHPATFGWQEIAVGSGENATTDWRARGNQVGWVDEQFVYLLPDAAFAEVQKVASAQREPLTMAPRTLWSRLHERGFLAAVDARAGKVRHVVRLSVGGQRMSCLQFARATLFPPTPAADVDGDAADSAPTTSDVDTSDRNMDPSAGTVADVRMPEPAPVPVADEGAPELAPAEVGRTEYY